MKSTASILLTVCLSGCATAIPGIGLPASGVVVDNMTGAVVVDAYVIMHVDEVAPFQGFQCDRVRVAQTTADGTFVTRPWTELPLGPRQETYYVYKRGYVLKSIGAPLRFNMERSHVNERIKELNRLARLIPCLGDPSSDVVHILELIGAEQEELAPTAEERESTALSMKRRIEVEQKRLAARAQGLIR